MTELDVLAEEMRTSGRSLRRAMDRGTIRGFRPSPRTLVLPMTERLYVRRHWQLLQSLLQVLRTQPNVRLGVLFGSVACGNERPDSDLDLLVRLRQDSHFALATLGERLRNASGRTVQLVSLEQAHRAPLLLADVLRDGRVLVDRDGDWPRLNRREAVIARRAREEDDRLEREAWALPQLLAERGGKK
jgi:predicted nucleotidyltransferase